jgi:hypothetical protein
LVNRIKNRAEHPGPSSIHDFEAATENVYHDWAFVTGLQGRLEDSGGAAALPLLR